VNSDDGIYGRKGPRPFILYIDPSAGANLGGHIFFLLENKNNKKNIFWSKKPYSSLSLIKMEVFAALKNAESN
jgi:hypothetical protein